MMGYSHPQYAASLAEFGVPHQLPRCSGSILVRQIEGTSARDAMGCYPIFACRDWSGLKDDLDTIDKELASVVVVSDPFGDYTVKILRDAFHDLIVEFKEHFIVDLDRSPDEFVDSHHQRNARTALKKIEVELVANAPDAVEDWNRLYAHLIARHRITGIARFSRWSLEQQLKVPGATLFRALREGRTVGMAFWYVGETEAYYHLGAYSEEGYKERASFALFIRAIEDFTKRGLRRLELGAGAGATAKETDGLSRFKRGWSTSTRTAYLCGRILNHDKYREITEARRVTKTDYFPAYRQGEFI